MNIQVQLAALAVIILIMMFFFGNKKIGLYTEKIFSRVLIGGFICLAFDILSVIVIVNSYKYSEYIIEIICKIYLVMLLCMGFAGFDYIMTDLMNERRYHMVIRFFAGVTAAEAVLIFLADVEWVHESRVVYSQGQATTLTYIFTFTFILATTVLLFIKRKKINPRRRLAMGIWMGMWTLSALIQFFNNEILLVGLAVSLGILTIFFMLENPESQQDRRIGCFNSHAMLMFLSQVYERGEKYCVLDFIFDTSVNKTEACQHLEESIKRVVNFCSHYKGVRIFKNIEDELIVLTEDASIIDNFEENFRYSMNRMISDELDGNSDMLPSLSVLMLDDCSRVKSREDLFVLLSGIRTSLESRSSLKFKKVDEKDISKYYRYNEVRTEIENALSEDRVEVFYQPIYSTEKKRIVSCEALARIRKQDGTLLSPGEFIPVAESTGLIVQLGERVFVKVCSFLEENRKIYKTLDYVEINLSVAQLEQKSLAERFITIMKEHGIAPNKINLEITETAAITTKNRLLENMNQFLEYGIAFSLDDFGKGQSNLMYLVEMPISIVKLDMDMTKAFFVEPKAKHVVTATVRMAHELGLHVVSEGVEEKHELEAMERAEIDYIQGYYFSRPLPAEGFKRLLSA